MKDMSTEQLLCWSGMTNTELTISNSNEEEKLSLLNHQGLEAIRTPDDMLLRTF